MVDPARRVDRLRQPRAVPRAPRNIYHRRLLLFGAPERLFRPAGAGGVRGRGARLPRERPHQCQPPRGRRLYFREPHRRHLGRDRDGRLGHAPVRFGFGGLGTGLYRAGGSALRSLLDSVHRPDPPSSSGIPRNSGRRRPHPPMPITFTWRCPKSEFTAMTGSAASSRSSAPLRAGPLPPSRQLERRQAVDNQEPPRRVRRLGDRGRLYRRAGARRAAGAARIRAARSSQRLPIPARGSAGDPAESAPRQHSHDIDPAGARAGTTSRSSPPCSCTCWARRIRSRTRTGTRC